MAMRPIIDGLRERISAAERRLAEIDEEREEIKARLVALKTLLASEEEAEPPGTEEPSEPMEDFIKSYLRRRARTKPEIAEAVEKRGYIKDGQYAGRVVHAKLIHMANSGVVTEGNDGKFSVTEEAA